MLRRTVLIAHQHLAVEHLVVAEHIVDHLVVQVLRRRLEGDFHAAGFLGFEVDITGMVLVSTDKEA